ncbi:MAG: GNAT family N-acetyltransferase [Rhodospirillales bacterium]|nr:GNAT family N-acetyltransferase [Rhodospirillales bacterium]
MIRIRKVVDDRTPANRTAIAEAQAILKRQFPGMPAEDIDKLPAQLRDPLKYRFVSELFVAEDAGDRVRGVALLLSMPDLRFCYLEMISAAPGKTGGGIGAAIYERLREEAVALGSVGLFFECLPDDPILSPDPAVRGQNEARLRFYERYGARPIAGTAYETPLTPGNTDPPYLVFDGLGQETFPGREAVRAIVRAILERKYGDICPPAYIDMVVRSITDDPVRLRPLRYRRAATEQPVRVPHTLAAAIPMIVNDAHEIHHVRERGYVEAPVRVRTILAELDQSGLFRRIPRRRFSERFIRAVHDGRLVDYLEKACKNVPSGKSIYPYVFPIRNAARPPTERTVRAGYYCIDTFTPLNQEAFLAARQAVDCALTAAEQVLEGSPAAYALVRPPGHHAEPKAFGGFCYFNNSAIAAHYLSRFGRVAVLDVDYHHGNGTQEIFYERSDVLTVSLHGHPNVAYPYFSGFRDEMGRGRGAGFNVNIPLPEIVTPQEYRNVLRSALKRIARFAPVYLVLALGLDTAKGDPTGTWSNRGDDFETIGNMIGAEGYPTIVVQEGGYHVRTLGKNVRRFFSGLATGLAQSKLRLGWRSPREVAAGIDGLVWREDVRAGDVEAVRALAAATAFFTTEEVTIAAELVEERVDRGLASGYAFVVAEEADGRLAGYACYGSIAGAPGRFDLYWLVVRPARQRSGLGRELLRRTEATVTAAGGQRMYVETSGRDLYAPTRAFYRACGYRKVAELPDFFSEGDAKVIFAKEIPT